VNVSVGVTTVATTFVEPAGVVNLADVDGLLLPFDSTSGAGQTIDLTLSDATTVPVAYDEVNNTISVENVSYDDGDAIYLDGNKLEVFDYHGLTVVSVDVAPLLVEGRAGSDQHPSDNYRGTGSCWVQGVVRRRRW